MAAADASRSDHLVDVIRAVGGMLAREHRQGAGHHEPCANVGDERGCGDQQQKQAGDGGERRQCQVAHVADGERAEDHHPVEQADEGAVAQHEP